MNLGRCHMVTIGLFCIANTILLKNFVGTVKYGEEMRNSAEEENESVDGNEVSVEKTVIKNRMVGMLLDLAGIKFSETSGRMAASNIKKDRLEDTRHKKMENEKYLAHGEDVTEESVTSSFTGMRNKKVEKMGSEQPGGFMSNNQFNIILESTSSLRDRFKDFFGWFCAYLIESQDTGANEPIKMVSRDSTKNSSHTTALTDNNDGKYQLEDHKDDIFKFHKMSPEQIKRFIDAYASFYNDHAPTYTMIDKLFLRTPSRIKERHAHLAALRALNIQNIKRRDRYAFLPIWQCTEIISVLLSALSLLNTIIMYHTRIQGRPTPLHNLYTIQYRISCITWIGSILLHIDDNRITRFCDYFSALLGIMYYFYTVIVRLLLSFKVSNIKEVTTHIFNALTLVYISVVYHNITNFNSGALKFVSGVFIILFLVAIIVQSIFFPNKFIKYIVVLTIIGVMVESSDIEPFCFVLDSHAMWHFVIGIQNFYYNRYLAEEITLMGGNL